MPGGGGKYRFLDWFPCPECNEREDISSIADETDIVLECDACGLISESVIGRDISLQELDIDAIQQVADEVDD